jgi:hypothetical protein
MQQCSGIKAHTKSMSLLALPSSSASLAWHHGSPIQSNLFTCPPGNLVSDVLGVFHELDHPLPGLVGLTATTLTLTQAWWA